MDDWGWEHLRPWLSQRPLMPIGPLFWVVDGPSEDEHGPRHAYQLRHAHAVEMTREGISLNVIQRQLGHTNLRVTSIYLQGIDSAEIINAVHARQAPMMPASAGLQL